MIDKSFEGTFMEKQSENKQTFQIKV